MRKITVSVQVDAEKLRAIQFYTGRKQSSMEGIIPCPIASSASIKAS